MILAIETLLLSSSSSSSKLSHGSYFSGGFEIRPVCNITSSGKSSSERLYLYKALRCLEASKLVELISLRVSAHTFILLGLAGVSLGWLGIRLSLIKTVVFFTQISEVQFLFLVSLCSPRQPETPSRVSRLYALRAFCRVRDVCSANADTQSR